MEGLAVKVDDICHDVKAEAKRRKGYLDEREGDWVGGSDKSDNWTDEHIECCRYVTEARASETRRICSMDAVLMSPKRCTAPPRNPSHHNFRALTKTGLIWASVQDLGLRAV